MKSSFPLLLLSVFAFAVPAHAEFTYSANGRATGLYGYTDAEKKFEQRDSKQNATGDFEANFEAAYEFDEGYRASVNLDLMSGIDHELKNYNQGNWGEEAYGIVDSPYGRIMGGQTFNVAKQFHAGAPSVGPLGVNDSRIVDFLSNPNWTRTDKRAGFATLNSTDLNTDGVAPKISYISPEFYDSLIGFSYVPDAYNRRGLINKHASYESDDGYIAALYHHLDLDVVGVTASLGYAQYHKDDKEYSAGVSLSRGNWTLGGSYRKTYVDGDDAPINQKIAGQQDVPELFDNYREGDAWDVGVGYEIGPYKVGLSYFNSKAKNTQNEDRIVMLSNAYQVNKYLDVYAVGAYAKFKGNTRKIADNNQGYAFVTGASLNF